MNKKREVAFLGMLICIFLGIEIFLFNQEYIFQKSSNLEERHLPIESGTLNQLSYEDGKLISQGIDPNISFENLNIQIHSIFIQCKNSLLGASGQVFYQTDNQPSSVPNSISYNYANVSGYENILSFSETKFVSKLRIDPTNLIGDTLTCQDFVINPPPQFHITLTRLILYVCLLTLGMFEFSIGANPRRKYFQDLLSPFLSLTKNISRKFLENELLLLPLIWVSLWLLPWSTWLDAFPWVRIGISLLLFVTPGLIVSILLTGARFSLPVHFSCGLAFSVFWAGTLGFTGRVVHWPFEYVKILFALSGLIVMLALIKHSLYNHPLYKPTKFSGRTLILLLFMVAFGIIANFQSRHSGDDLSYLAYLTNWQHAQQLDFQEVIFGTGTADSIRFWWGMTPMSLALLAEISHLHGLLLIGFYLEPFLMATAILTIYNLYEDLLPSQNQAIIALLLQFTFLFLIREVQQPGQVFFERLSEDKVLAAFILAPVFFIAVRHFINSFSLGSGVFFLLSGLSLALTHPIILAYSVFIVGVYSTIETLPKKAYPKLGIVAIIVIIIIAPSASLRFIDETWVSRSVFGLRPGIAMSDNFDPGTALDASGMEQRISRIGKTSFYGFNLEKIKILANRNPKNPLLVFLSWSYLWFLGLGFVWSLFNLKKDVTAPFIAATSLLVLLCAIPYTGWLVGYFVSARMLWRVPWLLPIGLISFVLLRDLLNMIEKKTSGADYERITRKSILHVWAPVLCMMLVGYYSEVVYQYQWLSTKSQFNNYRNILDRLSELGHYIENNIEEPSRFIASPELMNYLPGLTSKSKVVLFRIVEWAPYPIDVNEIDSLFSNDLSIPMEQRVQILDKYNVRYILIDDPSLKDYYIHNLNLFSAQYINGFWIVKFRE